MNSLPFYIVDVFADAPYRGNQLAVFRNAQGLSTQQMQQIAREIGFAESAFISSDQPQQGGFDVRFFTVEYEVPFAGHPTLGTAFIIQQFIMGNAAPTLALNLKAGQIPVSFKYRGQRPDFLFMRQINPSFGPIFPKQELAAAVGLPTDAFHPTLPVQEVSTGLPFLILPVQRLKHMRQLSVQPEPLLRFLQKHGLYKTQRPDGLTVALYFFCPETYSPHSQLNARMLAYENNQIIEDAATGSANGCLLSYLLHHKFFPATELELLVEQGVEMNRNATIKLKGKRSAPDQYDINVGGQVQLISKGEWYVY
ncbi:PhzF family phenazine biosynthesis protein [Rufibacter quisquiliarum]|uniref:Trans-2,3-dihydro-3-hydroxyanthranilate isomerase n=1 Tax=Rufibacter quisquiliarum TaxID=1549639 RepID=A0A839GRL6_9BACT|nr:PhzF family phenazine biosynthesis protein [Rufibacter quisquiliarum]MBA9076481.1 trans-2,3-dihydro-3-hydroxyanthranilate isomerase [Rufibacter quisquiliarum]